MRIFSSSQEARNDHLKQRIRKLEKKILESEIFQHIAETPYSDTKKISRSKRHLRNS